MITIIKYLFEHLDKVVILVTFCNVLINNVKKKIKKRRSHKRRNKQ